MDEATIDMAASMEGKVVSSLLYCRYPLVCVGVLPAHFEFGVKTRIQNWDFRQNAAHSVNTGERYKLLVVSHFVTSNHKVSCRKSGVALLLFIGMVVLALLHTPTMAAQPKASHQQRAPHAAMDWGVAAYQQGNDDLALRYFQQAWAPQSQLVGLKVVDPTPLVWQAKCYARLGEMTEAANRLNEALALAQPGSQAYALATKVLLELFPSSLSEAPSVSNTYRQTLGGSPLALNRNLPSKPVGPAPLWQQPIAVWVQPEMPASLPSKQRQRLQLSTYELEGLVRQWQPALPAGLPITVTSDASVANVHIEWVDGIEKATLASPNSAFTSGLTQWQVANQQLTGAIVSIAVRGPSGQPRTKVALLQTTLHELGHVLGLAEHSTQVGDIMAAHGVGSYHVSAHDLARLQALYSPPDSSQQFTQ